MIMPWNDVEEALDAHIQALPGMVFRPVLRFLLDSQGTTSVRWSPASDLHLSKSAHRRMERMRIAEGVEHHLRTTLVRLERCRMSATVQQEAWVERSAAGPERAPWQAALSQCCLHGTQPTIFVTSPRLACPLDAIQAIPRILAEKMAQRAHLFA